MIKLDKKFIKALIEDAELSASDTETDDNSDTGSEAGDVTGDESSTATARRRRWPRRTDR